MNKIITLWRILYHTAATILLLGLAAYAFIQNDQGRDFFLGVSGNGISLFYITKTSFVLFLWCLCTWYFNRLLLQVKDIGVEPGPYSGFIIKWLPRSLAMIPLMIMILALFNAAAILHQYRWGTLLFYTAMLLLTGVLLMLFFMQRARIARWMGISFREDRDRYLPGATPLRELMRSPATRIAIYGIIGINIVVCILFFLPASLGFARWMQPATVILYGLIVYTLLLSILVLVVNPRKSPAFLVFAAYLLLAGTLNDNSSIRTLQGGFDPAKRESITENFTRWIASRLGPERDSPAKSRDSVYPVILVAAEGGGIRGLNWTAQVLHRLNELHPGFTEHVYAVSGVSGGGVGAVFYAAYYHDMLARFQKDHAAMDAPFIKALGADFLSDISGAFIFPENAQRLLPFPVNAWNRNRKLEDSWGIAYRRNLMSDAMDSSFLATWYANPDIGLQVPNLFINGAIAETGQKAITSNLQWHSDSLKVFSDDVDVLAVLGRDIPMKTAASLCARFPVISSGALLKENETRPAGHILDGGYRENTGIETAWQIALGLTPLIRKTEMNMKGKIRLPIYILFIQNSTDAKNMSDGVKAKKLVPDFTTILPGFLNAWDRRTSLYRNITSSLFADSLLRDRYRYFDIRINNAGKMLPLGWYLSDTASANIRAQVMRIGPAEPILAQLPK